MSLWAAALTESLTSTYNNISNSLNRFAGLATLGAGTINRLWERCGIIISSGKETAHRLGRSVNRPEMVRLDERAVRSLKCGRDAC